MEASARLPLGSKLHHWQFAEKIAGKIYRAGGYVFRSSVHEERNQNKWQRGFSACLPVWWNLGEHEVLRLRQRCRGCTNCQTNVVFKPLELLFFFFFACASRYMGKILCHLSSFTLSDCESRFVFYGCWGSWRRKLCFLSINVNFNIHRWATTEICK